MAEPSWLQDMTAKVRQIERDEAGAITTSSFLKVAEGNQPVFAILFNGTLTQAVGSQLLQSNKDGVEQVRRDAAEAPGDAGQTLLGLVKHQVAKLGVEACGKPGVRNATKSILWLNRELTFICMVMRLLSMGKESSEAGYQAYEVVIKPYHPWLVQKLVGNAVAYVPALPEIITSLQIASKEEGMRQLEEFCDVVEKLSAEVTSLLEKEQANFQGQA